MQLGFFARLLARHADGAEAFALLRPHVADSFLATALVVVTAAAGLDEEAAGLPTTRIQAKFTCGSGGSPAYHRSGVMPWNAIGLLGEICERRGRVDDATALLHPERPVPTARSPPRRSNSSSSPAS